jgi:ribosomal-protein-alanine N-acetyltransferase
MPIELTGERICARDWRIGDAERVWRFARDQVGIFTKPGEITSLENAERWLKQQVKSQSDPGRIHYRLALELLDEDTLIGGARINVEDAENRQASLGYALHRSQWGKGYATEAATLMLGLAFERLSMHRVEALIDLTNKRSLRVGERLGLRREGHMKGRIFENDQWLDMEVFAITEDEWRAR